jgi:urease accessory protein
MDTLAAPIGLNPTRTVPVAGRAHLQFARSGAHTIATRSFATSPVKLFTTRSRGTSCWVYSATLGGGLVGGDVVDMVVDIGPGARAMLATQASTKVYRALSPVSQSLSACVGDDALLAVVPDPIVCFAEADFSQAQRYELSASASLVAVDWLTSGRHAAGERWAFARYRNRIEITRNGQRVFYDGLTLEDDGMAVAEKMGKFEVCLTAVVTGPLVAAAAAKMVAETSQLAIRKQADLIESASPLSDGGTLLRMAGVSVEQVGRTLRDRLAFLPSLLDDDPWSRKW